MPSPPLTSGRRLLLRLLALDLPHLSRDIFHKEALVLDREAHPNLAHWASFPHEAHRPPDALGLNPHIEVGGSAAYLYRNLHHLRPALSSSSFMRAELGFKQ